MMTFIVPLLTILWGVLLGTVSMLGSNIKVSRNFISTIHASLVLIFYTFNVSYLSLFAMSFSYYIFDALIEFYEFMKLRRLYNLCMIVHHLVSCFAISYLLDQKLTEIIYYAFCMIEISNFPIYLTYYLIQKKFNNKIFIKFLILSEAVSFFVLRLYIYGSILLGSINEDVEYQLLVGGWLIYVISLGWFYGMLVQLFK
jgi:hypothetical protein